jgi:hypothetical protein
LLFSSLSPIFFSFLLFTSFPFAGRALATLTAVEDHAVLFVELLRSELLESLVVFGQLS